VIFKSVIDVGACDWFYAEALAHFFPEADLLGLELDGGRRYLNLFRRADLGRARARALVHAGRAAEYRHSDFLDLISSDVPVGNGPLLFTFFFPFVSRDPCVAWGLPPKFADFSAMVLHACKIAGQLKREVWVLSIHQGEWEGSIAQGVFNALGLAARKEVILPEDFREFWPAAYPLEGFITRL